jgi:large subunit ribosomal protein L25
MKMQIEKREVFGKNKVNKMRVENLIPGVIYSREKETQHVNINSVEFLRVYRVAGTSSMIDLELDGVSTPVIIKEVQRHPVRGNFTHIDFQELNMKEKIKMHVPISLLNRDSIKLQPSTLMQFLDEVEIECLPGDIPFHAELDVENMDFATALYVSDLDIAKNDKIEILTELDQVVCTLSEPTIVSEEANEDEVVSAEVPTVSETEED